MKTIQSIFMASVENLHLEQAASLLYFYPNLYRMEFEEKSIFDWANSQTRKLLPIIMALAPDFVQRGLNESQTSHSSDTKQATELKEEVMDDGSVDDLDRVLDQDVKDLIQEQMHVLFGLEGKWLSTSEQAQLFKKSDHSAFIFEIKSDPIAFIYLTSRCRAFGISLEMAELNQSYSFRVKPESFRTINNLFENLPIEKLEFKEFAKQSLSQPEKIYAFEMCFEGKRYLDQVMQRLESSPLNSLYQSNVVQSNLQQCVNHWFCQVGQEYLASHSLAMETLDEDSTHFEREGTIDNFSATLQLPGVESLSHKLTVLDKALQKEILFEICFQPQQFITNYFDRVPNCQKSDQEFVEAEMMRYQIAMRRHLPETVLQDHPHLDPLQHRGYRRNHFLHGFALNHNKVEEHKDMPPTPNAKNSRLSPN